MILTRQHYCLRRQEAFTLIEVLIVVAIISIGMLSAMSMQISAINTNTNTRKSTLAMEYATDTMERLMQVGGKGRNNKFGFDDDGINGVDDAGESELTDGIDNDDDGSTDEADEREWHQLTEFQPGAGHTRGTNISEDAYYDSIFNLTWNITDIDCDGDGSNDSKQIDITVTWSNGNKAIQLTNMRTNIF